LEEDIFLVYWNTNKINVWTQLEYKTKNFTNQNVDLFGEIEKSILFV